MFLLALCVLGLLTRGVHCTDNYLNEYAGPIDFECEEGYGLTSIESSPIPDPADTNPDPDDRGWSFTCGIQVRTEFHAFFIFQLLSI